MPTSTIGTVSRDYSTLASWEADTDNDMSGVGIEFGDAYDDSDFTASAALVGATNTDASNYRHLRAAAGQEFNPVDGSGFLMIGSFQGVSLVEAFARGSRWGFVITSDASLNGTAIGEDCTLTACFHDCDIVTQANRMCFDTQNASNVSIFSCIAIGQGRGYDLRGSGTGVVVYNCIADGRSNNASPFFGFAMGSGTGHTLRNCVSGNNTVADFQGTDADEDYLADEDGTAGGANSITVTFDDMFQDAANDDYRPASDAVAIIDDGVDLSGTFTAAMDVDNDHAVTFEMGAYDEASIPAGGALVEIIDEVEQLVEDLQSHLALARLVDEVVQLTETTIRPRVMARLIDEVVQIVETAEQHRVVVQLIDEVVQIVESTLSPLTMVRLADEAVQIVESTVRPRVMARQVDEVIQIIEATEQHRAILKLIDETVNISETTVDSLAVAIVQIINEILQVSETVEQHRAITQLADEAVQIVETINTARIMARTISEVLEITDEALRSIVLVRVLSEIVQVSDQSINARVLVRLIDETIQLIESTVSRILIGGGVPGPIVNVDILLTDLNIDVTLADLNIDVLLPTTGVAVGI